MNLKMDIQHFDSKDIITTSVCAHSASYHIYVTSYDPFGDDTYDVYDYDDATGKFKKNQINITFDLDAHDVDSTGWYYSLDDYFLIKCDENAEHPVDD